MNSMNEVSAKFESKLRRVTTMLSFLGADAKMRAEVFRFYRFQYVKKRSFENNMFDELPVRRKPLLLLLLLLLQH
jgi:hypothetical protein